MTAVMPEDELVQLHVQVLARDAALLEFLATGRLNFAWKRFARWVAQGPGESTEECLFSLAYGSRLAAFARSNPAMGRRRTQDNPPCGRCRRRRE